MAADEELYRSERRRVFSEERLAAGAASCVLSADNTHYLHRVLRLRDGDEVELADGSGRLYAGVLRLASPATLAELRVVAEAPVFPRRVLFAALIKGQRWEWMIEKAGELGADVVVPIRAARSVVDIAEKKIAKKLERWQKIADSAARQCERLSRLEVAAPLTLREALERNEDLRVVTLDETAPLASWSEVDTSLPLAFAIGPEGGWTDQEREQLCSAGALSVGLGRNLLRAESAAVATMAMVRSLDYGLLAKP